MSGNKRHTCVFGLGWGDEGKGKVVDLLCPGFQFVVRFNGGANAGHTVYVGKDKFALHLLPAGVLHDHVQAVIGSGVVVDPTMLISELDALARRGIDAGQRLRISDRAHLVLPYHKIEDQLSEGAAKPGAKIGTTARGIGPCYADKMRRTTAIRFADLAGEADVLERARRIVEARKSAFQSTYGNDGGLNADDVALELKNARERLSSNICDTTALLHKADRDGQAILFEGANGVLLDIDHGTYPFVTSSSTGPYGIGPGAGLPDSVVSHRIGTAKAYSTRVGSGPFVTELKDALGDRIRERGREFGTTTGRPRRCGWFDAVACRYSAAVSGATGIALMHLDTLSGFDEIGVCMAYRVDGRTLQSPPASASLLERAEPVIEFHPGWTEDLGGVSSLEDLPENARAYLRRLETLVGVPITMIGVGPERSQMIVHDENAAMFKPLRPAQSLQAAN